MKTQLSLTQEQFERLKSELSQVKEQEAIQLNSKRIEDMQSFFEEDINKKIEELKAQLFHDNDELKSQFEKYVHQQLFSMSANIEQLVGAVNNNK